MKKLHSRLKSKTSQSNSRAHQVDRTQSISLDQTRPTYGVALVSGLPVESTAGQGPQTTSALLIAANTVTAVAPPAIASHDSQKGKHGAVTATSPSKRAQIGRLAYNAATEILPLIQAAAEAIPVAGSPIAAVIGGLLKVMNALDVSACIFRHSWRANTIALLQKVEQNKINVGDLSTRPEIKELSE